MALALAMLLAQTRAAIGVFVGPLSTYLAGVVPVVGVLAVRDAVRSDRIRLGARVGVLVVTALSLGLLSASLHGYSTEKVLVFLFSTTPLCIGFAQLVHSEHRVRALLVSLVVLGSAVVITAELVPGAISVVVSRRTTFGLNPLLMGRLGSLVAVGGATSALVAVGVRRWWFGAASVLGLWAALASGSRGPAVAAMAGVAAVAACRLTGQRSSLRARAAIVMSLCVGVAAGVLFAPRSAVRRIRVNIFDVSTREDLLGTAWSQVLKARLFGVGMGDFGELLDRPGERVYAHNLLLEAGAELGLLALVALVALFAVSFGRAWQARRTWGAAVLPILVCLTVNAFVSSDLNGNWAAVACALAVISLHQNASTAGPSSDRGGPRV